MDISIHPSKLRIRPIKTTISKKERVTRETTKIAVKKIITVTTARHLGHKVVNKSHKTIVSTEKSYDVVILQKNLPNGSTIGEGQNVTVNEVASSQIVSPELIRSFASSLAVKTGKNRLENCNISKHGETERGSGNSLEKGIGNLACDHKEKDFHKYKSEQRKSNGYAGNRDTPGSLAPFYPHRLTLNDTFVSHDNNNVSNALHSWDDTELPNTSPRESIVNHTTSEHVRPILKRENSIDNSCVVQRNAIKDQALFTERNTHLQSNEGLKKFCLDACCIIDENKDEGTNDHAVQIHFGGASPKESCCDDITYETARESDVCAEEDNVSDTFRSEVTNFVLAIVPNQKSKESSFTPAIDSRTRGENHSHSGAENQERDKDWIKSTLPYRQSGHKDILANFMRYNSNELTVHDMQTVSEGDDAGNRRIIRRSVPTPNSYLGLSTLDYRSIWPAGQQLREDEKTPRRKIFCYKDYLNV